MSPLNIFPSPAGLTLSSVREDTGTALQRAGVLPPGRGCCSSVGSGRPHPRPAVTSLARAVWWQNVSGGTPPCEELAPRKLEADQGISWPFGEPRLCPLQQGLNLSWAGKGGGQDLFPPKYHFSPTIPILFRVLCTSF